MTVTEKSYFSTANIMVKLVKNGKITYLDDVLHQKQDMI